MPSRSNVGGEMYSIQHHMIKRVLDIKLHDQAYQQFDKRFMVF
jgi:hypothetical protein